MNKFGLIFVFVLIALSTSAFALSVDSVHFNNNVAGKQSSLIFRLVNDGSTTTNVDVYVNWSSVFQKNRHSHIDSLKPNQAIFVVQTVNFSQVGSYTGTIKVTSSKGTIVKTFDEEIGRNPVMQPLILHLPFPEQLVNETTKKRSFYPEDLNKGCYEIKHLHNYVSSVNLPSGFITIGPIDPEKQYFFTGLGNDDSGYYCLNANTTGPMNLTMIYFLQALDQTKYYYNITVKVKPIFEDLEVTPAIKGFDFKVRGIVPSKNVFVGISRNKDMKDCNSSIQTGCVSYEKDVNGRFSQTISTKNFELGNTKLYLHACKSYVCSDTKELNVRIRPKVKVEGYVKDLFTNKTIPNAKITINGFTTQADSNGHYVLECNSSTPQWGNTTVTATDYTPAHTWVNTSEDYRKRNFTLVPADFDWKLYDLTMRGNLDGHIKEGVGTLKWYYEQPDIWILNKSSEHTSSVSQQAKDVLWNVRNRLVKFNPENTNLDKVKIVQKNPSGWWKHKMIVSWSSNIPIGSYSYDSLYSLIIDAQASFNPDSGYVPDRDSAVYNQELGSCMGATNEPNFPGVEYLTVFAGFTKLTTYSKDDYEMGKIYTHRSLLHYHKKVVNGLDDEDWELRPDIIQKRYDEATKEMKILNLKSTDNPYIKRTLHLDFKDGRSKTWTFPLNKVPQDLINSVSYKQLKGLVETGMLPEYTLNKKSSETKTPIAFRKIKLKKIDYNRRFHSRMIYHKYNEKMSSPKRDNVITLKKSLPVLRKPMTRSNFVNVKNNLITNSVRQVPMRTGVKLTYKPINYRGLSR